MACLACPQEGVGEGWDVVEGSQSVRKQREMAPATQIPLLFQFWTPVQGWCDPISSGFSRLASINVFDSTSYLCPEMSLLGGLKSHEADRSNHRAHCRNSRVLIDSVQDTVALSSVGLHCQASGKKLRLQDCRMLLYLILLFGSILLLALRCSKMSVVNPDFTLKHLLTWPSMTRHGACGLHADAWCRPSDSAVMRAFSSPCLRTHSHLALSSQIYYCMIDLKLAYSSNY